MTEQRKSPRKATLSKCLIKHLFIKEPLLPSRIINYSVNGVMLETDRPYYPGDAINVYFSPEAKNETPFKADSCVGMVRWCAQQDGMFGGFYGVGVELATDTLACE